MPDGLDRLLAALNKGATQKPDAVGKVQRSESPGWAERYLAWRRANMDETMAAFDPKQWNTDRGRMAMANILLGASQAPVKAAGNAVAKAVDAIAPSKGIEAWHGSNERFSEFKVPAFFSEDSKMARSYAKARAGSPGDEVLYRAVLSPQKIASEADIDATAKHLGVYRGDVPTYHFISPSHGKAARTVVPELQRRGFDSARITSDFSMDDPFTEVSSIAVFDPKRIKILETLAALGVTSAINELDQMKRP